MRSAGLGGDGRAAYQGSMGTRGLHERLSSPSQGGDTGSNPVGGAHAGKHHAATNQACQGSRVLGVCVAPPTRRGRCFTPMYPCLGDRTLPAEASAGRGLMRRRRSRCRNMSTVRGTVGAALAAVTVASGRRAAHGHPNRVDGRVSGGGGSESPAGFDSNADSNGHAPPATPDNHHGLECLVRAPILHRRGPRWTAKRSGWDSNPRTLAGRRFSRPLPSSTRPPLPG
jgi:hypothetical protein